jgi:hypothetical protein
MVSVILFLLLITILKKLNYSTFSNFLLPISMLLLCNLPCLFVILMHLVSVSFAYKPNSLTASSNLWYILFSSFSVLARIVTSSAYAHIWLIFVNIVPLLSTFSIVTCRIILNSVVDRPSPCFTPLRFPHIQRKIHSKVSYYSMLRCVARMTDPNLSK